MRNNLKKLRHFLARLPSLKSIKKYCRRGDMLVAAIYLLAVGCITFFIFDTNSTGVEVEIKTASNTFLYQLNKNTELTFDGPLGETLVSIQDERVFVTDSPGPLKICIKRGEIYKQGQWLACLPNKIFIRIVPKKQGPASLDAISF